MDIPAVDPKNNVAIPAVMFLFGLLGNGVAIAVLCNFRKEHRANTFYMLVCALVVTDLLGTCLTSPVVMVAYARKRWPGDQKMCDYFSFMLLFFGVTGPCILCAMSVERAVAIRCPYFYNRCESRPIASRTLFVVYVLNGLFCALPVLGQGFGRTKVYPPYTWCFIDLNVTESRPRMFSLSYVSLSSMIIVLTVLCNGAACLTLVKMRCRRGPMDEPASIRRRESARSKCSMRSRGSGRGLRQEMEMLWLMVLMTIVFLVCCVPLIVCIFLNVLGEQNTVWIHNLRAIRIASINPILDPWVYILCRRKLVVRFFRLLFCHSTRLGPTVPHLGTNEQRALPPTSSVPLCKEDTHKAWKGENSLPTTKRAVLFKRLDSFFRRDLTQPTYLSWTSTSLESTGEEITDERNPERTTTQTTVLPLVIKVTAM
uniref:prostaglandin E2 receptor EP4 subtype-like n=1 Tax=Myxine glutinosa TaxID=7769 RepID=UPI00358E76EE